MSCSPHHKKFIFALPLWRDVESPEPDDQRSEPTTKEEIMDEKPTRRGAELLIEEGARRMAEQRGLSFDQAYVQFLKTETGGRLYQIY